MLSLDVTRGDITTDDSDAIVNAANSTLLGGGGVDGAIHAVGGPEILEACRRLRASSHPNGLPTGSAVATTAGFLPANWVIHTVGPKHWEHPDGGRALLARCHTSCLDVADEVGAQSIAFPAISCGVYGWDPADAAPIALDAVRAWLITHPDSRLQRVRFVLFNHDAERAFAAAL